MVKQIIFYVLTAQAEILSFKYMEMIVALKDQVLYKSEQMDRLILLQVIPTYFLMLEAMFNQINRIILHKVFYLMVLLLLMIVVTYKM